MVSALDAGIISLITGGKRGNVKRRNMKVLRVLTRIYLAPSGLDKAVAFYEKLFCVKCDLRFKYVEAGLELASIESVLLIAG